MAIEPMTALNLLLVCELIHTAESRDQNFINFLHNRFWASYAKGCHGRYLHRTIKSVTLTKHFNNSLSNDTCLLCFNYVSTILTFRDITILYRLIFEHPV